MMAKWYARRQVAEIPSSMDIGLPIVNICWLLDMFALWQYKLPVEHKYNAFPAGFNFCTMMNLCGCGGIIPDVDETGTSTKVKMTSLSEMLL
jgi:hypothetical protein